MLIKVKTLTGKGGRCLCEILRIKERVEEKEGIPPAQQRLIFGGKQMYVHRTDRRADEKTVKDFGIEGGTVLHLVLSLRGGSTYA